MIIKLGAYVSFNDKMIIIFGLGYLTSCIQKLTVLRFKENVKLNVKQLVLEFTIFIVSAIQYYNI